MGYEHKDIEKKWQKIWDDNHVFEASNDFTKPEYQKYYAKCKTLARNLGYYTGE